MTHATQSPDPSVPRGKLSVRGPKILTFTGGAALLGGLIAAVTILVLIAGSFPTNVVTDSGGPGAGARAGSTVSGSLAIKARGGHSQFDLMEVAPLTGADGAQFALEPRDVTVLTSDADSLTVTAPAFVRSSQSEGFVARTFASFRAESPGTYTITITPPAGYVAPSSPDGGSHPTDFVVADAAGYSNFEFGYYGFIALTSLAVVGVVIGGALLTGGLIWWRKRRYRISGLENPEAEPAPPSGD